jgi:signal transduction histidine kinase
MRLSNRYWTVLAGGLAGGLTTLVIVLPSVHFAYRSATLHATIETAAALVTLLAAYLALSRFRGTGRSDDLALTTALGLLACASFAFSALPWALLSGGPVRFSAWMSLIGTAAGAGVLCLAALAPGHALSRPRETARKTWALALAAYLVAGVFVSLFESRLPLGIDPAARPSSHIHIASSSVLFLMQLSVAVLLMVAAVGFVRRGERTGDELMTWLAASALLASFARVNYALFPSLYTDWVYVGDALRLGSCLLLLGGCAREIDKYRRRLAEEAAAEERDRLATQLHDGLAQELALVALLGRSLGHRPHAADVEALATAAQRALDESRRAIAPPIDPRDEGFDDVLAHILEELVVHGRGVSRLQRKNGR